MRSAILPSLPARKAICSRGTPTFGGGAFAGFSLDGYVIHSRDDEVVPFEQAEARALALGNMGRPVVLDALSDVSHYQMGLYTAALARGGRWIIERWNER